MEAPHLREGPVTVRPLGHGDVATLGELALDRAADRWADPGWLDAGWLDAGWLVGGSDDPVPPDPVALAAQGWAEGTLLALAVEIEGRCGGVVALRTARAGGARVGCALLPWARGRGSASAASRLALTWAFTELGAAVVHWRAEVGNWPARRVAWACGMTVDAHVRSSLVRRDERVDAWVGSLRWHEPLEPRQGWLEPSPLVGAADSGASVHLGPLLIGDVPRMAEACASPLVQAWMPELPAPYTSVDAISFVATREEEHAAGRGVYWAVRDVADGPLTGTVAVFGLTAGARAAEVGYWMHPDVWGRGCATAALRAVAAHALAPVSAGGLGRARVVVRAARGNHASRRVALRAGLSEVGIERRAQELRDGTVTDLVVYDAVTS